MRNNDYPIVGRPDGVDISKHMVQVHGREVIDYEKIKSEDPELYNEIIKRERESNKFEDN